MFKTLVKYYILHFSIHFNYF